jgi:anti-anti-sigma regulatory factor
VNETHRLDMRLHAPRAGVVVVRVAGAMDEGTTPELRDTLRSQLDRATHVIVDLADVCALGRRGAATLAEFDRSAARIGCHVHVTDVPDRRIRNELISAGMAPNSSPETVVALLPPVTGRRAGPHPPSWTAPRVRRDRGAAVGHGAP